MSKTTKTVLIVLGVIAVIYFLFGRKKTSITPSSDGTLPVATEKPVVENTADPNAVNAAGQPLNV